MAVSRAIALFSSARRNGNTGKFIDRIAAELGIEVVDLGALRIAPYDYEHRNRDDDFEPLMGRVLDCGQVIFASPVYWYSVTPAMKAFLDRVSDYLDLPGLLDEGRRLRGKDAYVVCTSVYDEAPSSFVAPWKDTFEYLGMRYRGLAHANCRDGYVPARQEGEVERFVRQVRKDAERRARAR